MKYYMDIVEDYVELSIFVRNICEREHLEIVSVVPDVNGVGKQSYQMVSKGYIVIYKEAEKELEREQNV